MLAARDRITTRADARTRDLARLAAGLALIAFWWPVAWREVRPISDYYFFPLWLGYILSIDGVLALRSGTSPMRRSGLRVGWMFVASMPLWWAFELLNELVNNWRYQTPVVYTDFEYFLLASLAFSTVIPAVLTTSELVRSFNWDPLQRLPRLRLSNARLMTYHLLGWLMIALTWLWPSYAFPLVWLALFFLLDPLVSVLGGDSIARYVDRRDWSPVFNLGLGALVCGFFWEFWNTYSMPKWTYEVPYVEVLHIFEMPLLGYGGYIPFGLEVFAVYQLCRVLAPRLGLPRPVVSRADPVLPVD